jgi:hypothetical protein
MVDTSMALAVIPENAVDTYRTSTNAASLCRDIVKQTASTIQGKKYVAATGWQAIAVAHGCSASAVHVEKVEGGFRATGQVRRMDTGAVIAEAEGFVGEDEPVWFGGKDARGKVYPKRPDFAIRAMAQTRAISRACRSAFAHVVVMIDKDLGTTPAEEMQGVIDHEPDSVLNAASRATDQARADIIAQTGDGRSTYQVNKEKKERAAQVTLYKSAKQAISMCGTRPELDEWWRENQATLEDKLPDAGFQEIVTALDARRSDLPPM